MYLFIFSAYILVILAIGLVSLYRIRNLSDYMVAGRSLSGPLAALGAGASDMSGWLLMGLPGIVFLSGLNQIWTAIGLSIGAYLNWQFEARRLRVFTEVSNNSLTIPSYLENRFKDKSRSLRIVTSLVILVFFMLYVSAGLVAGALLLQSTLGLSYSTGLLISTGVIVTYTCLGGFVAITWIDFFQGSLMFLALLIVPMVTFFHLDTHAFQTLVQHTQSTYLDVFQGMSALGIISLLAWGLGYFGQPHIIVRFMAVRSTSVIPQARFIGMTWMIFSLYGALFTGILGAAYVYSQGSLASLKNPETIFIYLSQAFFTPWVAALLVSAILSAIMSTSSAQLLSAASSLTEDLYRPFLRPHAHVRESMIIVRLCVIAVGAGAAWLARSPDASILKLVSHAWAGLGASFGPVILLSLYWKGLTRNGAVAGMIAGAICVLVWTYLEKQYHGIFDLYSILPAFSLNLLVMWLVSTLGEKPEQAIQQQFDDTLKLLKKS